MQVIQNDVFRMINVRGPADELEGEPITDDDDVNTDGPVVRRLESDEPLNEDTLGQLRDSLSADEIDGALNRLSAVESWSLDQDSIVYGGVEVAMQALRDDDVFRRDYAVVYNDWLLRKLQNRRDPDLNRTAVLLGDAAPVFKRSTERARVASVLLSKRARSFITQRRIERANTAFKSRSPKHKAVRSTYERVEADLHAFSRIETGVQQVLAAVATDPATRGDAVLTGRSSESDRQLARSAASEQDQQRKAVDRTDRMPLSLDPKVTAQVRATIGERATTLFNEVLAELGDNPPVTAAVAALADRQADLIAVANAAHWELTGGGRFDNSPLPDPTHDEPLFNQGAVDALGWGDLIVARETLLDYEAKEIAHIENVLKNEKKNREHTLTKTVEETIETEAVEEKESERELETTTRHELHIESERAIEENFSIDTGVNTSGRYGLTKVETSLDLGFNRSAREAQASTTNIAKEIVSKAVERTFSSVRELRRRKVTTELKDLNIHELDNVQKPDGEPTSSISGIYRWVEKLHQVELRHYGTRMMVEFNIPEPAISIVGGTDAVDVDMDEPQPPNFDASRISSSNYLSYARKFGAKDIEPPPDAFIHVGFTWSSQPSESDDEDTSEDVFSELVAIPDGYRPINGEFEVSAHPAHESDFQIRIQIADRHFSRDGSAHFSSFFQLTGGGSQASWPGGVPVSMTAHGHFDKTLSMNIMFVCFRQTSAWRRWQIAIYDKLMEGYERQRQEYDAAVEAAQLQREIGANVSGDPSLINRRTEREELQKWATKILRRDPFDFDATVVAGAGDGQYTEVDPARADQQATLVRFYQEAFEWDNMSYFFYPYFWGRRNAWKIRQNLRSPDSRFESFLRAGAARVVVPVTPGYEARILYYLANADLSEAERVSGQPFDPTAPPPPGIEDTIYNTLWLELAIAKNEDLVLGSGFLNVTQRSAAVEIVESQWRATGRDVGRELFIDGDRYEIEKVVSDTEIVLSTEFSGDSEARAPYATGSVAFGPPWVVKLPTNLVVLDENKANISLRS